ncbi:MAG: hypothetical protein CMP59_00885 [Flavobacteriales bacterium]|nr:hypothetical protein [Flavobacteriales bacterium]|tara:strand:+ start:142 stop:1311 length:1170 start_codon:yes stop_codon:yes gene_type:complete
METKKGFGSFSKQIIAIPLEHKGKRYIGLEFDYDKILTKICKRIGAIWGKHQGIWYLDYNEENFEKILQVFRGEAWVDIRRFKQKQVEKIVNQKYHYEVDLSEQIAEELDVYVRKMRAKRYSASTFKSYLSILKRYFTYYKLQKSEELTDDDLVNYMNDVVLPSGYSEVYQRQLIGALKLFYKYVHGEDREFSDVPKVRRSKKLPEVLSKEEVMELFECTNNLKHEFTLKLIYGCGLRVGDATKLKQRDIDLDRMVVHVKIGKGRKDRLVPFPKSLKEMYLRYLKRYNPREFVLEGQFGGPYSATSVNNIIKRACMIAGIKKHVTAHTLRHSFATHIISNGGSVYLLKEILGHASTKTTQIYIHLNEQDINSVENPLDRIMKDAGKDVD